MALLDQIITQVSKAMGLSRSLLFRRSEGLKELSKLLAERVSRNPDDLARVVLELETGLGFADPKEISSFIKRVRDVGQFSKISGHLDPPIPKGKWLEWYSGNPDILGATAFGHPPQVPYRLPVVEADVSQKAVERAFLGEGTFVVLPEEPLDALLRGIGNQALEIIRKNPKNLLRPSEISAITRSIYASKLRREATKARVAGEVFGGVEGPAVSHLLLKRERERLNVVASALSYITGKPVTQVIGEAFKEANNILSVAASEAGGLSEGLKAMAKVLEEQAVPVMRVIPEGAAPLVRELLAIRVAENKLVEMGVDTSVAIVRNSHYWHQFQVLQHYLGALDTLTPADAVRIALGDTTHAMGRTLRELKEEALQKASEVAPRGSMQLIEMKDRGARVFTVPELPRPDISVVGVEGKTEGVPEVLVSAMRRRRVEGTATKVRGETSRSFNDLLTDALIASGDYIDKLAGLAPPIKIPEGLRELILKGIRSSAVGSGRRAIVGVVRGSKLLTGKGPEKVRTLLSMMLAKSWKKLSGYPEYREIVAELLSRAMDIERAHGRDITRIKKLTEF